MIVVLILGGAWLAVSATVAVIVGKSIAQAERDAAHRTQTGRHLVAVPTRGQQ